MSNVNFQNLQHQHKSILEFDERGLKCGLKLPALFEDSLMHDQLCSQPGGQQS